MPKADVKHILRDWVPAAFNDIYDESCSLYMEDSSYTLCKFRDTKTKRGRTVPCYGEDLLDHMLTTMKANFLPTSGITVHALCFDNKRFVPKSKGHEQRARREDTLARLASKGVPMIKWDGVSPLIEHDKLVPNWERLLAPGSSALFTKVLDDLLDMILQHAVIPEGRTLLITGLHRHMNKKAELTTCTKVVIMQGMADGFVMGRCVDGNRTDIKFLGDMRVRLGEADLVMMHLANVLSCLTSVPGVDQRHLKRMVYSNCKENDLDRMPVPSFVLKTADTDALSIALLNSTLRVEGGYHDVFNKNRIKSDLRNINFVNRVYIDLDGTKVNGLGDCIVGKKKQKKRKIGNSPDTPEHERVIALEDEVLKTDDYANINMLFLYLTGVVHHTIKDPVHNMVTAFKCGGDDFVQPKIMNVPHIHFANAYRNNSESIGEIVTVTRPVHPNQKSDDVDLHVNNYFALLRYAIAERYKASKVFKKVNNPAGCSLEKIYELVRLANPKSTNNWLPPLKSLVHRGKRLWWVMMYCSVGVDVPGEMLLAQEMGWITDSDGHFVHAETADL